MTDNIADILHLPEGMVIIYQNGKYWAEERPPPHPTLGIEGTTRFLDEASQAVRQWKESRRC